MSQCLNCGSEKIKKFGIRNGKQRYACNACKKEDVAIIETKEEQAVGLPSKTIDALHKRVASGKIKRYVITAAQNATPIYRPFFNSLLSYCKRNNAQLLIIPYRYHNPTSMWSKKAEDNDWWSKDLRPYLYDRRIDLGEQLTLLGDIKMQPTAIRPTMGFENITSSKSAILGHPKLELLTIPTPNKKLPKIIVTTGAVTKKNYIQAKAGKRAEHHHTFGAAVVELGKSGFFFLRQINATRSGSFCDLDMEYYPNKKAQKVKAEGLILGDLHVSHADPSAVAAIFGARGMVKMLQPKKLVWHDVLDFYSRTPHHEGEVFINFVKHHTGSDNVEVEVEQAFAFIDKHSPEYTRNIFVYSNHPDMLARWIKRTDPRSDPENCVFWAKTFQAMCAGSKLVPIGVETIDPFAWWARTKLKCIKRSQFLSPKESYLIKSIDVGYHGHVGLNGARGNRLGFSRIGVKTIIGHAHTPGITEGAYQVGTTSYLALDYMKGPSSWLHCHCVIYRNGKRSLLISVGEEWRA